MQNTRILGALVGLVAATISVIVYQQVRKAHKRSSSKPARVDVAMQELANVQTADARRSSPGSEHSLTQPVKTPNGDARLTGQPTAPSTASASAATAASMVQKTAMTSSAAPLDAEAIRKTADGSANPPKPAQPQTNGLKTAAGSDAASKPNNTPACTSPTPARPATGGAAILARMKQQKAAAAAQAAKLKAEADAKRAVAFLYASQTGTAEEVAKSLHDEAQRRKLKSKVASLNEWGFDNISAEKSPVLIVVAASTGDGDPPDNSNQVYSKLKRPAASDRLKGMSFTVLGLGDSNYTKFMEVSRNIKRRLFEQGACEFYGSTEADEVDGIEDIIDAWSDGLWEPLSDALAAEDKENQAASSNGPSAADLPVDHTKKGNLVDANMAIQGAPAVRMRRVEIKLSQPSASTEGIDSAGPKDTSYRDPEGRYSPQQPFWATLKECRYLTSSDCPKRVLHIGFDVSGSGMKFEAGDAMSVEPHNDSAVVDALLKRLNSTGKTVVQSAKYTDASDGVALAHLCAPCTLQQAFTRGVDITSPPSKSLLVALAQACTNAQEAATLRYLASRDGREAYKLDIVEGHPTLVQLLNRYPSCQPPVDMLLEALPPLRPRLYSLSNSPLATPDALECAFHVVEYDTHFGPHQGVATSWFERLGKTLSQTNGHTPPPLLLPVHMRPSTGFRPPADASTPLIMIGPGTGVAPFRGFLQHRRAQRKQGATLGESWLFFGNWKREWDFLYAEELQGFVTDGTLTHLQLAWSRETDKKVYVQSKMQNCGEQLCEALLEREASVFVCGDGAAMAKDVHTALKGIVTKHGDMDGQEADDFLKDLAVNQKYLKDVWM